MRALFISLIIVTTFLTEGAFALSCVAPDLKRDVEQYKFIIHGKVKSLISKDQVKNIMNQLGVSDGVDIPKAKYEMQILEYLKGQGSSKPITVSAGGMWGIELKVGVEYIFFANDLNEHFQGPCQPLYINTNQKSFDKEKEKIKKLSKVKAI